MSGDRDIPEYDHLDVLVNRLLGGGGMPVPTVELTAEMVEFYKTPVRVVIDLAELVNWGPEDVFFDLGSGLGQVVVLVNILTGVVAKGVEIEPAYCEYARACASANGLSDVEFIVGDARVADLSVGSVFFLFTPFKGEVFLQVMDRLRVLALTREIRVIGYGPCSAEIARLGWLRWDEDGSADAEGGDRGVGGDDGEYTLQIFSSSAG